jgi:uncharacterized membrane protein YoaK (UPF0700 family)
MVHVNKLLPFWAFIINFVMGTLLVIAISRVRSIRKAIDGHSTRYRSRVYKVFSAWAFLLALDILLAFVHEFHPAVYNAVHNSNIVNLLIEVLNTIQVCNSNFIILVCRSL